MKTTFIALISGSLSFSSSAHARSGDYWPQTTELNACYVEHIKSGQAPVTDPWADTELRECMKRRSFYFCANCGVNGHACRSDTNGPDHPECYRAPVATVPQPPAMPSPQPKSPAIAPQPPNAPDVAGSAPNQLVAQTDDLAIKRAMAELAGELTECSVFFWYPRSA
jgi:hypothetical protein